MNETREETDVFMDRDRRLYTARERTKLLRIQNACRSDALKGILNGDHDERVYCDGG